MSGYANPFPVGATSVGGNTWFGSAPVPLSSLSQQMLAQGYQPSGGGGGGGSSSFSNQKAGGLFTDKGPFASKNSFGGGPMTRSQTVAPSYGGGGGGHGGGNWSVGYQHQKANTADGRMHGYSYKLQSKPRESGLDWIENNSPLAKMGQQMGSAPATLTGTVAPYQGPLKDDGINSGGISAGQPFRSNRDDEWFQATDGTGAPIGRGSYTATKPGVVLTPKQQKDWDMEFEMTPFPPAMGSPKAYTWDSLLKALQTPTPDPESPPNFTGNVQYIDDTVLRSLAADGSIHNPVDLPPIGETAIRYKPPVQQPTRRIMNGVGAVAIPPTPPVTINHNLDWLAPTDSAWGGSQPQQPATQPQTPRGYTLDEELEKEAVELRLRQRVGARPSVAPVIKTAPRGYTLDDWLNPPVSVMPEGARPSVAPVIKTAPTPNPPTTRPMTAYELGAPADLQQARKWARDLWVTAERTGDKGAKDLATKAVAWANLPPGQRQSILSREERTLRLGDQAQTFRSFDPKLDKDALTNRTLWDDLNKYNKTGKLPDTVTTKGTRKELRDSKGNLIGFSEDKGVKPKGGTVTDNGQTMSFDDWFELHNPATQKRIEAEVAKRLAA